MMLDKAIIIVAVADYGGAYASLPGAITSAQRMRAWATAGDQDRDYDLLYITDEDKPVTVERLADEINPFLQGRFIDRLVVYFAGHGILRSTTERFWLLSNAAQSIYEGVDVETMRRALVHFGFGGNGPNNRGQVCIISDACQDVSRNAMDFRGHGIIDRPPQGNGRRANLDRFYAASPGERAFQIDAAQSRPAYCLFSDTLLDALDGNVEAAIERTWHPHKPAIISSLLCEYLESEVPIRARSHGIQDAVKPESTAQIQPPSNFYRRLDEGVPPGEPGPSAAADRIRSDESVVAMSAGETVKGASFDKEILARRSFISEGQRWIGSATRTRFAEVNSVAVCDFEPLEVYAPFGAEVAIGPLDGRYTVGAKNLNGRPILISQGKHWIVAPHYPGVLAVIMQNLPGDLMFQKDDGRWDTVLCDFTSSDPDSQLRSSDATDLADNARFGKGQYPHQAVTASYLYEFANDYDNIARTAHYLVRDGYGMSFGPRHPDTKQRAHIVPFDVALLCAQTLNWNRKRSEAFADIPAVAQEERSLDRPRFAAAEFDALHGVELWGIAPVYRAGWKFLEWNTQLEVPQEIRDICPHVGGRSATNLDEAGLEKFVTAFGYKRVEPEGHSGPRLRER